MAQLSDRVRALMQPHLASIEPYDPNFTPCRVNLSANENTYSHACCGARVHRRRARGHAA